MLSQLKRAKRRGRRWLSWGDRFFGGFLAFLLIASFLITHFSPLSRVPILSTFTSSPSSTSRLSNSVLSVSEQGSGKLTTSQPPALPSVSQKGKGTLTVTRKTLVEDPPDPLTSIVSLLSGTDPGVTFQNKGIVSAWVVMLGVADLFLVVFLLLNGIRITLGGMGFRYAEALEALPRIILAYAAAHISLLFVACLIGINNGICQKVVGFALVNDTTFLSNSNPDLGTILGQILLDFTTFGFTLIFKVLLILVEGCLFLFLWVQLVIRLAMVDLMIILAPLGFACWALPQGAGQQVMRIWLNGTVAVVMVQFLQVTFFFLGGLLIGANGLGLEQVNIFGIQALSLGQIAVLWFTLRIPGLLQNVVANMMGEGSRNMAGMISQAIGAVQSAVSTAAVMAR